jgi:4-amino-4-deoxy-L-arabinose transferase-like glycosyltransferase
MVRTEVLLLALVFFAYLGMVRHFSSDVPGGSDSWGYVSEAMRLGHGRFYEPERVLSRFGLPEDPSLTHPLAYLEKGPDGTVPTYPFGYPLLMAMAIRLLGLQAAFWVTPLLAAGAVLLTYWLGRAFLGPAGGVVAAVLVGVFPNFLSGAFQPMSDVPAAFFGALTLVALLAMPAGIPADVTLGAALGFGVWVRPNLGLLIGVVGLWLVWRREWRRLVRVALAVAPFLLVEVLVNWHLFGAPWRSGYGELPLGGPLAEILARGARHLLGLNVQQAGVGLLLFVVALIWNRLDGARRLLLAGVFGAFLCFFAAYRIDDAWWYFRFLVPAMPAVAILEAGFLMHLTGPGRLQRSRVVAVALATCALAFGSLRYAERKWVFSAWEGEQRYPRVAAFVAGQVKQPALVLAMQHSGSIRFYTDLTTARYDLGTPEKLADTLTRVAQAGGNLYLVVDDGEIDDINAHGRSFLLAGADLLGVVTPGHISLFRLKPAKRAEGLPRGGPGGGQTAAELALEAG